MPHLPSISLETGWCADAPRPTADFKRRRRQIKVHGGDHAGGYGDQFSIGPG